MLRVVLGADNICLASQLRIERSECSTVGAWFADVDPFQRYFAQNGTFLIPLDPISESGLLSGSFQNVETVDVSFRPQSIKVRDNIPHDDLHYGTFLDAIQGFASVISGASKMAPPGLMSKQHNVRHHTFRGKASTGMTDLRTDTFSVNMFNVDFELPLYGNSTFAVLGSPNGPLDYTTYAGYPLGSVYNALPVFDYLSRAGSVSYEYSVPWAQYFRGKILAFNFSCSDRVTFNYDASMDFRVDGIDYFVHYHFFYLGGTVQLRRPSLATGNPLATDVIVTPSSYGTVGVTSNNSFPADYHTNSPTSSAAFVIALPLTSVNVSTEYALVSRLGKVAAPFWDSVNLSSLDVTALSRDTATVALKRLSEQAYSPDFKRIGAINPLKLSSDSLSARTADAALKDAQRFSLKKILGFSGGAGLVKYRTIFSDCLQLINSLEVLGEIRNSPSRLYVDSAFYDYHVVLGDRDCKVRVRSKVYLELSPLRLLQILAGRQVISIIDDVLALYYSSQPLGEILLVLLQLRKVEDIISSRMFFDLPMFFVHSYTIDSQLTSAEMDYTGISTVPGSEVVMSYYWRDVSQHLPVLRPSRLAPLYGTGDVGDVIWTLLQQIVGVLSSGT
jgi:hypothetical protein